MKLYKINYLIKIQRKYGRNMEKIQMKYGGKCRIYKGNIDCILRKYRGYIEY